MGYRSKSARVVSERKERRNPFGLEGREKGKINIKKTLYKNGGNFYQRLESIWVIAQELQERQHSKDIKATFNLSRTNKLIGRYIKHAHQI
ncbi:MAG: hypothetical protein WA130_14910 [Candidatus Methanoperedens sp.]